MSATEETVSTTTETPPAETPAPAVEGAQPPETEALTQAERDERGRFKNPVQPRIDELTRQKRESERERDYWKARAEAAAKPPEPPPSKPTQDQFANYADFVEALTDWKADEKVRTALETRDKQSAEKQKADTRTKTWVERSAAAKAAIPDLDRVLSTSDVPVASHVTEQLLDSEQGPQLAYHLATHPDVAERLNAMSPTQAARELGRLEATLSAVTAPTPEPDGAAPQEPVTPARRTTNAPPPVKPVAQSRSGSVDLAKAGMDDYIAERRKQGASWAR